MADKTIGELPKATELLEDSLLVMEQQSEAQSLTGKILADFARERAAADVQRAVDAAAAAEQSARDAADVALHPPTVEAESGHWQVWDTDSGAYQDSGLEARGPQGEPGEVSRAELDAALQRKSNPNLLDNWYFPNPINQRGVKETVSTAGYFIDRWRLGNDSSTVEIVANTGLKLNGSMQQVLEFAPGVACIASVLTQDGKLWTSTDNPDNVNWDAANKTLTITGSGETLVAAKLEVGTEQTLAHIAAGKWEINDAPPNPDYELSKCRRYYMNLPQDGYMSGWINQGCTFIHFPFDFSGMRATPTAISSDTKGFTLDSAGTRVELSSADFKFVVHSVHVAYSLTETGKEKLKGLLSNTVGVWGGIDAALSAEL